MAAEADPTVYPEEEKVGEESLQRFICELLRPLIERWLAERGVLAFTGADQFVYYRQHDPHRRVAPDVYVLPGVRPGRRIRSWKTWESGIVPSFALEVVSSDRENDYVEAPARYGELGVGELVVFDPDFEDDPSRLRFQVYRRSARRGLARVVATREDRVASRALGCHLVAVGVGEETRLRLGIGRHGETIYPTHAEHERAEKEHERAEKERERAARLEAEAELARLRAELRKR